MSLHKNDPGHGGKDPGACANGIKEKEYTLEAALYVNTRLQEHGIKTGLTRDTDTFLDSGPRTAIVRNSGATYCYSHHYNAGGGAGAEFIHSIHSNGQFEYTLAAEFKNAGYPVRRVFCRPGKSGKDYYYMHRDTGKVQTTIIEYDFVDGPNASKLKDYKYRQGMYECVVKAICRREGVLYVSLKNNEAPKDDITGHWAEESIRKAKAKGIIKGQSDTVFGPDQPVTRAQLAVILDRLGLLE